MVERFENVLDMSAGGGSHIVVSRPIEKHTNFFEQLLRQCALETVNACWPKLLGARIAGLSYQPTGRRLQRPWVGISVSECSGEHTRPVYFPPSSSLTPPSTKPSIDRPPTPLRRQARSLSRMMRTSTSNSPSRRRSASYRSCQQPTATMAKAMGCVHQVSPFLARTSFAPCAPGHPV